MTAFAETPAPPYYAVIFTSRRTGADAGGYDRAAAEMERLAARQPGYLGIESVRAADGAGITVSYWGSLEALEAWGRHDRHLVIQAEGRRAWYAGFRLRIARVERARGWDRNEGAVD